MDQKIDYLTATCEGCTIQGLIETFDLIPKSDNLLKVYDPEAEEEDDMPEVGPFKRISPHYRKHHHWFYGAGVATELNSKEEGNQCMLINIGGKGMDVLRSFGYSDIMIFKTLTDLGFKATRIDFSVDFNDRKIWALIRKGINEKSYVTSSKSMAILADPIKREIETIYVGSQKNREILLCMYDKQKEQNKKILARNRREGRHDRLIRFPWYRVELRLYNGSKNKVAQRVFAELSKMEVEIEFCKFLKEKISRFFRFLEEQPEGYVFCEKSNAWGTMTDRGEFKRYNHPGRWKTAEWWMKIVGEAGEKMPGLKLEVNDFEGYVDTMNIQCSKRMIKRFMCDFGPDERMILKNIKDADDKKAVLASLISNRTHILMDLLDYGVEHWTEEDQDFVDTVLIPSKKKTHPTPFLRDTKHEKEA